MYQALTGINTAADAINAMAGFAEDVGWTIHRNTLSANTRILTVTPDGNPTYFTIGNDSGGARIDGNLHRGISPTQDWKAQPDQYYGPNTHAYFALETLPATAIHAFGEVSGGAPYLYFAIELSPNFYRHLLLGYHEKWADIQGGAFITASGVSAGANFRGLEYMNYYPFMYRPANANSGRFNGGMEIELPDGQMVWGKFHADQAPTYHWAGCDVMRMVEETSHINTFDQSAELYTPELQFRNGDVIYDLGYPRDVRFLNMQNYQAKDEMTLGGDVWKIFPLIRKLSPNDSTNNLPASGQRSLTRAIAYRKS